MFLKEPRAVGMAVFSKTSSDSVQPISKRFLTEHNAEETPTTFIDMQKPNVESDGIKQWQPATLLPSSVLTRTKLTC